MEKSNIFETAVSAEKRTGFLYFLRNLGISNTDISYITRGDYHIYKINLDSHPDSRKKLIEKQTAFL